MDQSPDPEPNPQVELLRNGLTCVLTDTLNDEHAKELFLACTRGEQTNELRTKLDNVYDLYKTLVVRLGASEVDAWCEENGLQERFAAVMKARRNAKYADGLAVDTRATADRVSAKRAEVQRLTEKIREEETRSANMRVELARQEAAARAAERKLREAKLI